MKILVVYYSRSGKTKTAAETLAKELGADIEAIVDSENRAGVIGFLKSGRESVTKTAAKIMPVKHQPQQYDLVVICTPIWAGTMSSPVRTFINSYSNHIKKAAYIITRAAKTQDYSAVFYEMDKLMGKQRAGELSIWTGKGEDVGESAKAFANELKGYGGDEL